MLGSAADIELSCCSIGILEPLVVDEDGVLLDGYRRLEIAEKHELKYETEVVSFGGEAAKQQWILAQALNEKHLTRGQSMLLRHDLLELAEGQSRRAKARSVLHLFPERELSWLIDGHRYGQEVGRCYPCVRAYIWEGGDIFRSTIGHLGRMDEGKQEALIMARRTTGEPWVRLLTGI